MPTSNRGYFAIGVFHSKTEANVGTLLRSAHAFGAAFVFTIGRRWEKQASDTRNSWKHVPVFCFEDIDQLIRHLPYSCPLIGIELADQAKPINGFFHPERACYLLGAEDHGLNQASMDRCHAILQIPGASSCLNVASAGSIVMYDRFIGRAA